MKKEGKLLRTNTSVKPYLRIGCDKIVIKDKEIKMEFAMEEFLTKFDKIAFVKKDGKEVVYVKEEVKIRE